MSNVMEISKTNEVVDTYKTWKVSVEGVAPLILHNGQMANPLYEYTKQYRELHEEFSKDRENDTVLEKLSKTSWMGSLYLNDEKQVIIPSALWQVALRKAGKRQCKVNLVKTGVHVDCDSVLQYDGPSDLDQLYELEEFRWLHLITVGDVRVFHNCYPRFEQWSAEIIVQFDTTKFTDDEFSSLLDEAGMYCGICNRCPVYGRFKVVGVEEV